MRLDGQVDWVRSPLDVADRPGVQAGMGVQFIYDVDAVRERFHRDAERLMAGSLGERLARNLLAVGRRSQ